MSDDKTVLLLAKLDVARERSQLDGVRMSTENWIIGSLLTGEVLLFGKRVELRWPDGFPCGFTGEEQVKEYGRKLQQMARDHNDQARTA